MFLLESLAKFADTDRIAFVYGDQTLTFAELERQSNAFAAWLLQSFGEDRTPILIYGHKDLEIPACMFGALKAGRAYVPVDVTFPAERVGQIVEELQPKVVVNLRDDDAALNREALAQILSEMPNPARNSGFVRSRRPICSLPPVPPESPRAYR